jgi:hypothetical protein
MQMTPNFAKFVLKETWKQAFLAVTFACVLFVPWETKLAPFVEQSTILILTLKKFLLFDYCKKKYEKQWWWARVLKCPFAGCNSKYVRQEKLDKHCSSVHQQQPPSAIVEQDEQLKLCVVCFERELKAFISTCGHISMCMVCASACTKCPMCRKDYNPDSDIKEAFIA